jgi:hypothetical protein
MDALSRRVAVAEAMAPRYSANDVVTAVLLAGSTARGLADEPELRVRTSRRVGVPRSCGWPR